jgi:hypothetical protein
MRRLDVAESRWVLPILTLPAGQHRAMVGTVSQGEDNPWDGYDFSGSHRPCPRCHNDGTDCEICDDCYAHALICNESPDSAYEFALWSRRLAHSLRARLADESALTTRRGDERCYRLYQRLCQLAAQWLPPDELAHLPKKGIGIHVSPLELLAACARFGQASKVLSPLPSSPKPPRSEIDAAAGAIPAGLAGMNNSTEYFNARVPAPQKAVIGKRLIDQVVVMGHSAVAVEWAIFRLIQEGLLTAEQPKWDPNSISSGRSILHTMPSGVFGTPLVRRALGIESKSDRRDGSHPPTSANPTLHSLLLKSTDGLWEWWRSHKADGQNDVWDVRDVPLDPPSGTPSRLERVYQDIAAVLTEAATLRNSPPAWGPGFEPATRELTDRLSTAVAAYEPVELLLQAAAGPEGCAFRRALDAARRVVDAMGHIARGWAPRDEATQLVRSTPMLGVTKLLHAMRRQLACAAAAIEPRRWPAQYRTPIQTDADPKDVAQNRKKGAAAKHGKKLRPADLRYFAVHQHAIESAPHLKGANTRVVYNWLVDNSDEEVHGKLPKYSTFKTSISKVRTAHDKSVNSPRRGRTGRSIVRQNEIESRASDES